MLTAPVSVHRARFARCVWAVILALFGAVAHAGSAQRIVSLAPNLTELTFAAGAGARVIGTVEYSDQPAEASRIPRVGDAFRVDLERIVALQPDVVLAWERGTPAATVRRLRSLGLEVREFQMQRIADVPRVLRELGQLAGTEQVAAASAERYAREMADLRERFSAREPLTVFLQVNSRPLYTVNRTQIMSEVLELCGGRNLFGDLDQLAPQVSLEAVIARNPEVIVVSDEGDPNAVHTWRTWTQVEAVRTGNLYTVSANDLTRATTRLTQGAAALCRVLETARERKAKRRQ